MLLPFQSQLAVVPESQFHLASAISSDILISVHSSLHNDDRYLWLDNDNGSVNSYRIGFMLHMSLTVHFSGRRNALSSSVVPDEALPTRSFGKVLFSPFGKKKRAINQPLYASLLAQSVLETGITRNVMNKNYILVKLQQTG